MDGVHRLVRRLPEGAFEWVWAHTSGPQDQHSVLYSCESTNLQVLLNIVVCINASWCVCISIVSTRLNKYTLA
jgi:hypothetical protein